MSNNVPETPNTPAGTQKLQPEAVVAQLRAVRDQLPEITPLTPEQRATLRKRAQIPDDVLRASIDVLGASDDVSSAIKVPAGDVHTLQDETNRWAAVENELKALLNGVSGANLSRRYRLALIAAQAHGIGTQLAKDPANVLLVPYVQEVKRLKKAANRKKPQPTTPETPAPQPGSQPHLLETTEVSKASVLETRPGAWKARPASSAEGESDGRAEEEVDRRREAGDPGEV